jgi:hypothetical protein
MTLCPRPSPRSWDRAWSGWDTASSPAPPPAGSASTGGPADYGHVAGAYFIAWCLAAVSLPVLAGRPFDMTRAYGTAVRIAARGAGGGREGKRLA